MPTRKALRVLNYIVSCATNRNPSLNIVSKYRLGFTELLLGKRVSVNNHTNSVQRRHRGYVNGCGRHDDSCSRCVGCRDPTKLYLDTSLLISKSDDHTGPVGEISSGFHIVFKVLYIFVVLPAAATT